MPIQFQGNSGTVAEVDATSRALHATLYGPDGTAYAEKATFRAVYKAATPAASATAPFFVIQGSGTKTCKILRIQFSASAATGTVCDVWTSKFTAISGGTTGSAPTVAKADSNDASATAAVSVYSAVPTTATQADGFWNAIRYEIVTAGVSTIPAFIDLDAGTSPYLRPLILRGTGQYFGLGVSAGGTTPICDLMVEWTEE